MVLCGKGNGYGIIKENKLRVLIAARSFLFAKDGRKETGHHALTFKQELEYWQLPEQMIREIMESRSRRNNSLSEAEQLLVGSSGYVPPFPEVFHDAVSALFWGGKCTLERSFRIRENKAC
jgi:hypothetical protein